MTTLRERIARLYRLHPRDQHPPTKQGAGRLG